MPLGYTELDTGDEALLTQLRSHVPEGALVILSRDVPIEWLQRIMAIADRLSGVVWFMDDDIPGAAQDKTLPSAYRKRLSSWYKLVQVGTSWYKLVQVGTTKCIHY